MFRYFRETFLEPRGLRWFGLGLVIESCSPELGDRLLVRLREVIPYANFELLSKNARPIQPEKRILQTIQVLRSFGGLRLLLAKRHRYDLVVFFVTGEGELLLCRILALLWMRPKLFFVLNEHGEGFWLNRENWSQIRRHLGMRYQLRKRWDGFLATLRGFQRKLIWLAMLPVRFAQMLASALLFLAALLLLAVLRTTYDRYFDRFRIWRKFAAAPRRKLDANEGAKPSGGSASEHAAHDFPPPR